MDEKESQKENNEVSVIERARATIARTRERHRRRMEENVGDKTTTSIEIPPPPPARSEAREEKRKDMSHDKTQGIVEQKKKISYENQIPDKIFLSRCRKLCRALNQRLKRNRKSTKAVPKSIQDLNRDLVLFRHIVAQHIRQDSSTTLEPSFVKGKDVQELRAYLEEHFEEEKQLPPPITPSVSTSKKMTRTTKKSVIKSPEMLSNTPIHYRNSVADIALRATVLSRVRRIRAPSLCVTH